MYQEQVYSRQPARKSSVLVRRLIRVTCIVNASTVTIVVQQPRHLNFNSLIFNGRRAAANTSGRGDLPLAV